MSRPSPSAQPPARPRPGQPSDSTYHSFHDIELYESAVAPSGSEPLRPGRSSSPRGSGSGSSSKEPPPSSTEMRRQDSGYESIVPRSSQGAARRRTSTASSTSRPRTRPSIRRATKSGPVAPLPRVSGPSLFLTRSHPQAPKPPPSSLLLPTTFFHFPSPEPAADAAGRDHAEAYPSSSSSPPPSYPYGDGAGDGAGPATPTPASSSYHVPPQTTHYWTSDRTRRLEYAAIDAASRGVKGWVMKHMVPECFVPKERRRICFDDDRGSVRRYRLELETEESAEKDDVECMRRKGKRPAIWLWAGGKA